MPYSDNPARLDDIREALAPLERGEHLAWKVREGDERYWALRIREAFYIARKHPGLFPKLAEMANRCTVEVPAPGRVQTRFKNRPEAPVLVDHVTSHGQEQQAKHVSATLAGPTKAMQVIEWWYAQQPTNGPLQIPQSKLDEAELGRLYAFVSKQQPRWMILKPRGADSLTLLPYQEEVAATGAAWSPSQPVPAEGVPSV